MFEMVQQYIGDRSIPIALAIGIVAAVGALHEWADVHYMPSAIAEEADAAQTAKIDQLGSLLMAHIAEYDRNELRKEIQALQDAQYELQQFVEVNGPNAMTDKRSEDLRRRLADLQEIRHCEMNGFDNCR